MKKRLLIISSVFPFPRNTGQQQRVYYKIKALRENFHLTFLTATAPDDVLVVQKQLLNLCDEAIVLASRYEATLLTRVFHKLMGWAYQARTGLKFSNYLMEQVEFHPSRVFKALEGRTFDGILFEYWHIHKTARLFNIPTILDMHDILWRSYLRQLETSSMPQFFINWQVNRYQKQEEAAWNDFDILIAINQDELQYAQSRVKQNIDFLYTPMGTDISTWPYCWQPALNPRRIAFYGGMGNHQNQRDALVCVREILPRIWRAYPDIEFWIVGSNPPDHIKNLSSDPRIHVTGFVETPQEILKTMSLVLCPWSGKFGFRSRIVEVMALGIPVIASPDAIFGMCFQEGDGILISDNSEKMADVALSLIGSTNNLVLQSQLARHQIEQKFSYESTYQQFATELFFKI